MRQFICSIKCLKGSSGKKLKKSGRNQITEDLGYLAEEFGLHSVSH